MGFFDRLKKGLSKSRNQMTEYMDDLFGADEVIVTSSSNLCLHADHIDGVAVGLKDEKNYEMLRSYLIEEFIAATSALS